MRSNKHFFTLFVLMFFGIKIASTQDFGAGMTVRMAFFENYGVVYDIEKEAYCFNDEIIGLLVDEQYSNMVYVNPIGAIYLKVNRDPTGVITGIEEMTITEYLLIQMEIDEKLNVFKDEIMEKRGQLIETRERLNQRRLTMPNPPEQPLRP